MFNRIHTKLGTAGFIISIVALVAALGGGAYAANSALSGKQKKEVEKISKKFAGKPGATGAAGPAGTAGPAGATGPAGTAGAPGANGTNGTNGTNGAPGEKGETGTFGGELAPGATETGAWSLGQLPALEAAKQPAFNFVPISFPAPLPEGEANLEVVFMAAESGEFATPTAECPGTTAEPEAAEGFLCVYETPNFSHFVTFDGGYNPNAEEEEEGAGRNGAVLDFNYHEFAKGLGTWAATARG